MKFKKDEIALKIKNTLNLLNQIQSKLVLLSTDIPNIQKKLDKYSLELQKSNDEIIDDDQFLAMETEANLAILLHLNAINNQYDLGLKIPQEQASHALLMTNQIWTALVNKIIDPVTTTSVPDEIIKPMPQESKKRKKQVIIEENRTYTVESIDTRHLLNLQFQLLYGDNHSQRSLTFLKTQDKHRELTSDPLFDTKKIKKISSKKDDAEKWLSDYATCTEKAEKLVQSIQENYNKIRSEDLRQKTPISPEKLQKKWTTMEKEISQLNDLNQTRMKLSEQLNQFQNDYYVEMGSHKELESIENGSILKLKSKLKEFISKLVAIEHDKNDVHLKKYNAQVVKFITSITDSLKPVANPQAVNQLKTELNHLFQEKTKTSKLTSENTYELIDLLNPPDKIKENQFAIAIEKTTPKTELFGLIKASIDIKYQVIDPDGKLQKGTIPIALFPNLSLNEQTSINDLKPYMGKILSYTSKQNHTTIAVNDLVDDLIDSSDDLTTEITSASKVLKIKELEQLQKNIKTIRKIEDEISAFDMEKAISVYKTKADIDLMKHNLDEAESSFEEIRSESHHKLTYLIKQLEDNRYLVSNEFKKQHSTLLKGSLGLDPENQKIQKQIIKLIQEIDALTPKIVGLKQKEKQTKIVYSDVITIEGLKEIETELKTRTATQALLTNTLRELHQGPLATIEKQTVTLLHETHEYLNKTNREYQSNLSKKISDIRVLMSRVKKVDQDVYNKIIERAVETLQYINEQARVIGNQSDLMTTFDMIDDTEKKPESNALTRLVYINAAYFEAMELLDNPIHALRDQLKDTLKIKFQDTDDLLKRQQEASIHALKSTEHVTESQLITGLRLECFQDAQMIQEKRDDLHKNMHSFTDLRASRIWDEYTDFDEKNQQTRTLIEDTHKKIKLIEELTKRFESPECKESREILKNITTEFSRVLRKHIKTIKSINTQDKQSLLATLTQNSLENPLEFNEKQKGQLSLIDKRLPILLNMYKDFDSLNYKYISKNNDRLSDNDYKKELNNTVKKHLRNESMELISDGVNSSFWQWIRVTLFKLFNKKPDNTAVELTPTLGASETEQKAIQWGNRFFRAAASKPESTENTNSPPPAPGKQG